MMLDGFLSPSVKFLVEREEDLEIKSLYFFQLWQHIGMHPSSSLLAKGGYK